MRAGHSEHHSFRVSRIQKQLNSLSHTHTQIEAKIKKEKLIYVTLFCLGFLLLVIHSFLQQILILYFISFCELFWILESTTYWDGGG